MTGDRIVIVASVTRTAAIVDVDVADPSASPLRRHGFPSVQDIYPHNGPFCHT